MARGRWPQGAANAAAEARAHRRPAAAYCFTLACRPRRRSNPANDSPNPPTRMDAPMTATITGERKSRLLGSAGSGMFLSATTLRDHPVRQGQRARCWSRNLAAGSTITPQTIRKDLNDLMRQRAADPHPWRRALSVAASRTCNMRHAAQDRRRRRRRRSAVAAAELIPDNASLFINIGTTTEAVGQALLDHRELMVITNNINVANRLRLYPTVSKW